MTHNVTRTPSLFTAAPAQRLLAQVVADCGGNLAEASMALRVDRSTLHRMLSWNRPRSDGADRIAVALGRHTSELWPEWFTTVPRSVVGWFSETLASGLLADA